MAEICEREQRFISHPASEINQLLNFYSQTNTTSRWVRKKRGGRDPRVRLATPNLIPSQKKVLTTKMLGPPMEMVLTPLVYRRLLKKKLLISLLYSAIVFNKFSVKELSMDDYRWEKTLLGHTFSMSRAPCNHYEGGTKTVLDVFRSWLQTHEEAQIMVASILVVFGLWWLVRTILALLINLVCPLLFVLLAVICVPQLRAPLLGQNYPLLANLLRSILLKMAENLKT
ncbi:unnamed protein product [Parnassius mnemosyne]|uniref:Uncharacterized protein n=1 Tax=Parnassius mnemosyne TaxID=213953 RepID=A0AAV1M600_9NEOP